MRNYVFAVNFDQAGFSSFDFKRVDFDPKEKLEDPEAYGELHELFHFGNSDSPIFMGIDEFLEMYTDANDTFKSWLEDVRRGD